MIPYREGRKATVEEIRHSFNTGLPEIFGLAAESGPGGLIEVQARVQVARGLLGI